MMKNIVVYGDVCSTDSSIVIICLIPPISFQVRTVANQNPGRLLLLYKWSTGREDRSRCFMRVHGPVHGGGDQVRPANDEQPRGYEGGHTHGRGFGGRAWSETVAVRRVQQGR